MKYRALKSFFGDLGSIRRNQVLTDPDERITKVLVDRKLLVKVGDETNDGLDKLTIGKLVDKAKKLEIGLGSARTKAEILTAIRAASPARQ